MDVAELRRLVEYKFAPEPLLAVQALANTFSFETDEELLIDPPAARRWMVTSGLAKRSISVGDSELADLREFRGLVRELLETHLGGAQRAAPTRELERLVQRHPVPLSVDGDELRLDLKPVATVDALIAQLLGVIFEAQRLGQWERLKICASDECRWAFYDSSRNRGGTWCQMEVCGNRIKNREYRRRARA